MVYTYVMHTQPSALKGSCSFIRSASQFVLRFDSVAFNSASMSTVAMYYFQGDLGESQEYPNAFVIPNNSRPTFGQFLSHFPAHEKAGLHFRFRMEDATSEYVWLDISSPEEVLPFYQDSIMAKVLRTNDAITLKRKTVLRKKNMENYSSNIVNGGAAVFSRPPESAASAPPPRKPEARPVSTKPPTREVYTDEPAAASAPPAPKPAPKPATAPKPTPAPKPVPAVSASAPPPVPAAAPPAPAAPVRDMLDDDFQPNASAKASAKSPAPTVAAPVEDMLDFDDGPVAPRSAGASQKSSNVDLASLAGLDGGPTLSRAELKASRDDKINNQVQKALDEKQEQDRKKDQEQDDFDAARAKHDAKLLAWSTNNKERRNIRSLLSTMHTVLWEGTRWKTIGLGDLLEPKQVKLQYRKAMLVVHPDHNVHLTNENRYISKRIFEAVNEAYNEFTTKENV